MMINIKNIVLRFLSGNFVSKVLPGAGNFETSPPYGYNPAVEKSVLRKTISSCGDLFSFSFYVYASPSLPFFSYGRTA